MTTRLGSPDDLIKSAVLTDVGRQDPYALMTPLHDLGEAAVTSLGYVAVWGYESVNSVLMTPGLWKSHPDYELSTPYLRLSADQVRQLREASNHLPPWLVFSNPPYHTRLRGLVSKAFTARRMEQMRERVQVYIDTLLDAVDPTQPIDIVEKLTALLPQSVVGEIIGLSPTDSASFVQHSREQSLLKDPKSTFEDKLARMRDRAQWAEEIRALIRERERSARDDVITALLHAEQAGDRLAEPEMISLIMLLFAAGFDTSNNMMSNGIFALLEHPDQYAALASDPGLARGAVNEVLRYDTPGFDTFYYAVGEQQLPDVVIDDGQPIMLFLGIANRDPRAFSRPNEFDIQRQEKAPLSFGAGAHLCLGINLARLEGELLFGTLARRFPNAVLTHRVAERIPDIEFRGFSSLEVVLAP